MKLFEYHDYRQYLKDRIQIARKAGRREVGKIAQHLGLHATTFSQILSGSRQLSLENAVSISGYFGLNKSETRFFLLLVQLAHAGSEAFRQVIRAQIEESREESSELIHILPDSTPMSEEQRAVFYSDWYYSAVRVLSSIPGTQTPRAIAEYLGLPIELIEKVINFLIATNLCVWTDEKVSPGPNYTHLEAQSPLISRHHANWRLKAIQRHAKMTRDEVSYSSAMSLSTADVRKVRNLISGAIEEIHKIREPSECESAFFLNVDWLKLT
jgi:uncharacterized protein (TIGR02147 family)